MLPHGIAMVRAVQDAGVFIQPRFLQCLKDHAHLGIQERTKPIIDADGIAFHGIRKILLAAVTAVIIHHRMMGPFFPVKLHGKRKGLGVRVKIHIFLRHDQRKMGSHKTGHQRKGAFGDTALCS